MEGPDHKASSTPAEFAEYVQNIRRAEMMLGSPRKVQQAEEAQMAMVSRKSIVFSKTVTAGSIISKTDLTLQRPGDGILSQHLNDFIGKTLSVTVAAGTQARWSHLV